MSSHVAENLSVALSSEVAACAQQLLEKACPKPLQKNCFLRVLGTAIDSVTVLPLAARSGHEAAASQTEEDVFGHAGLCFDSDE